MAKRSPAKKGKALVIVESPAKARTIAKFLGPNYAVEASIGHVRDLPEGKKEVPEEFRDKPWAHLGVNVDEDFTPVYVVPAEKRKQITHLKALLKDADELYLATDEDREGEAISWHLHEILKPKVPVHRLVFHEITKEAIEDALKTPRQINAGMVRAQETRRILDRLYGYEVSPLLWYKVGPKLSAGRVQSVAVRLIVERERERIAFVSATWWDLTAKLATGAQQNFSAELVSIGGRRIPAGKDFDPKTGKLKNQELVQLDEAGAAALRERLLKETFRVVSVEEKPYTSRPSPPFTTSTLQQEANRKLGFTARRTMQTAQSLYENGYITYMRTDSTNLASVAVEAARELVRSEYGANYLPNEPREYRTKVKNAQEAHEAIRPAGHPFQLPQVLRSELSDDQFRLFEMIWKRTIASQMSDARERRISVTIAAGDTIFQATGKTIDFPGYLRAYVEGSDDPLAELEGQERVLPPLAKEELLKCLDLNAAGHTTQPPARFSEASLTRALEEMGIGRPSTYASIIDTILHRNYVFKKGNALVPTWTAFSVARLLEDHLPKLVDYQFTADMEDYLDSISRGEAEHIPYLRKFYFGNGQPGLKAQLEEKRQSVDAREVSRFPVGKPALDGSPEEVVVRVGRYGPFLERDGKRAAIPDGMPPDELTLAVALELLNQATVGEEPLGYCPDTQRPVYFKQGRFGPYVQLGTPDDDEKPKSASLLKGMSPTDMTLEVALRLLQLPRNLGPHPTLGDNVISHNGRFGPYVQCGKETRSLPADVSPLEVTLDAAVELLAQPKRGRGRGAAPEPMKTFENSPITGEPIKLLQGRYGPYVSDGTTNASLARGTAPDQLTFPQALQLLAERAAAGPSKKKAGRKAPAKAASKGAGKGKKKKAKKAESAESEE